MIGDSKSTFGRIIPIWLLGCVILIAASWNQITGLSGWDPDDQLRLVQLRDFLGGQGWFDTNQYRLNAPDGSSMHWSRVTELPLALIVLVLSPIFGTAVAEMIAGTAMPLLLLGATGWLLSDIAKRIGSPSAAPVAMILCVLTATVLAQMMPMRIDHHGWQITLASFSLWTLFRVHKRRAGLALGAALALWLHISLEGAPLAAAFFAYLGWRWIFHKAHGERLLWTIISFAGGSLFLYFATTAKGLSAPVWCDSISAPHLLAVVSAAVIMIPTILARPPLAPLRMTGAIAAGAAAFGCLFWFAPNCGGGAFAQMDPIVRDYWYGNVTEGLPIWRQGSWAKVSWLMPAVMGLAALFVLRRRRSSGQCEPLNILAFFQVFALLVALLVFRASAVACAFAIPLLANWLAGMLDQYRGTNAPITKAKLAISMLLIAMAGPIISNIASALSRVTADTSTATTATNEVANKLCQSPASAASLAALPNARIVATLDMGPAILLNTDHAILASSHHRNVDGMRDQINLFRSSPDDAKTMLDKREITHLAICPNEAEMQQYLLRDPEGLWAQMVDGKTPGWLKPLPDMGAGIKVWQVLR